MSLQLGGSAAELARLVTPKLLATWLVTLKPKFDQ